MPENGNENPDLFHVLHVEDELTWAQVLDDHTYKGGIKNAVEAALGNYAFPADSVKWRVARTAKDAIELMRRAEEERPGRGFDAVFCDLRIYGDRVGDTLDPENGLRVLRELRSYEWPGAVVVVSAWADDGPIIEQKENLRAQLRLDEWLDKNRDFGTGVPPAATLAKLRRYVVPVHLYERKCRRLNPPSIFENRRMRRLLRELVVLSQKAVAPDNSPDGWPLIRILLLGEPGSGKGMLARTFYHLLPAQTQRKPFITVNCANLIAGSGTHGGIIRLFGSHKFQGTPDMPGVFEQATHYAGADADQQRGAPPKLTTPGQGICWSRAGVVFLDEFVELPPQLQAAILNALEEGVVQRDGSGQAVRIGCHIVFATNATPAEIVGARRVRGDLLDRIPHVLTVPPLRERPEEIEPMLKAFAERKQAIVGSKRLGVDLSESARTVVKRAVGSGIITSVRQLQAIADLEGGENTITDGNLAPLFTKAALLGITDVLTQPTAALSISRKAEILGLPAEICVEGLPRRTEWAIIELYGRKVGELQVRGKDKTTSDETDWDTLILMSRLLRPENARRLCAPQGGTDPAAALRAARTRAARRQHVDLGGKGEAGEKQAIIDFLTGSE